jgi:hypothetical protein
MAGPRYCTTSDIARRMRGRLNFSQLPEDVDFNTAGGQAVNALLGYGNSAADQSVDLLLVDQIADQVEYGTIDLTLGMVYELPFKFTSEITVQVIKQISECLICSSLIAVAFEGQGVSIIPSSDISSASTDLARQAYFKLSQLCAGTNIYIPVTQQAQNFSVNVPEQTPLVLPGEIRLGQSAIPDTISRNYTFQSKRNTRVGSQYFNEGRGDCGTCSPRNSDGTAMGSDPNTYCIYDNTYYNYEKFD